MREDEGNKGRTLLTSLKEQFSDSNWLAFESFISTIDTLDPDDPEQQNRPRVHSFQCSLASDLINKRDTF